MFGISRLRRALGEERNLWPGREGEKEGSFNGFAAESRRAGENGVIPLCGRFSFSNERLIGERREIEGEGGRVE